MLTVQAPEWFDVANGNRVRREETLSNVYIAEVVSRPHLPKPWLARIYVRSFDQRYGEVLLSELCTSAEEGKRWCEAQLQHLMR